MEFKRCYRKHCRVGVAEMEHQQEATALMAFQLSKQASTSTPLTPPSGTEIRGATIL